MDNKNNQQNQNPNQNRNQGQNHNQQRRPRYQDNRDEGQKLASEIIAMNRVAKVTSGGKRLRFSSVVAVGDKQGKIGVGIGKGLDPQEAIQKATKRANESVFEINVSKAKKSIPHRVEAKYKSSSVLIKPAPIGTGVVAGGSARKILELAGIENVVSKTIGPKNPITSAYAAIVALSKLKKIKHVVRAEKTTKEQ